MMKKQPYEIIENLMMYLFGTVGFLLMICIAGFAEGGNFKASIACLVGFAVCISISCFFYQKGVRR